MLNRILGARACPATQYIVPHHAYVSANIAAELKLAMNRLKAQAISDDGLHVDYARIRSSEDYAAYREHMVPSLRMFTQIRFCRAKTNWRFGSISTTQ